MRKSVIGIKPILIAGIATAISFVAKSISDMLTNLTQIPIIGWLFRGLRFPFKIIGSLRIVFLAILIILIFIKFLLPVLRKLKGKISARKLKRRNANVEIAAEEDLVQTTPINPIEHGGPRKIDF